MEPTENELIAEMQARLAELQSENAKLREGGDASELQNLRRENEQLRKQVSEERRGFDNSMIP